MPPIIHNFFDPVTVKLENSNLIEASAGTGKTYSIAIMTLRLILEEGYRIDQILLVTFTKDAAAEMELRVREFMRDALRAAQGQTHQIDPNIVKIVQNCGQPEKTIQILRQELAQFDKAAIFTIHSFCARTLNEYAFEAGQLFRSSTLEPDEHNAIIQDVFNDAWRKKVTVLGLEELRILFSSGDMRNKLWELVKGHLNGKQIYLPPNKQNALQNLLTTHEKIKNSEQLLRDEIEKRMDGWQATVDTLAGQAGRYLAPIYLKRENEKLFLNICKGTEAPGYIRSDVDADLLAIGLDLEVLKVQLNEWKSAAFTTIALECAAYIENRLSDLLKGEGKITFDDMIGELHNAVCNNGIIGQNELIENLRKKYKAIFIDEFQDTDKLQYEIFSTLFQPAPPTPQPVLFYIGDPKQSIYAFRKADLQTYFRAAEEVANHYPMNTNHRSTPRYIEAMNEFFQPLPGYDVFLSTKMKYHPVAAPTQPRRNGSLFYGNNELSPIRILGCSKKENIYRAVVNLVEQLLFDQQYKLGVSGNTAPVRAGQIGILVRSRYDGKILRKQFARKQIPAITVSDTKIFESDEALDLLYVLKAAEEVNRGTIHRALLTHLAGYEWTSLLSLDEDALLFQFRQYQETWKSKGVYVFLRQFMKDVRLVARRGTPTLTNADRRLANVFQLMEMLHEAEQRKKYNPDELVAWLQKQIEGGFSSDNEYIQRIESDEDAIKIVTIHNAKGLEYDLVIAPFLDMALFEKSATTTFYLNGTYYTIDRLLQDSAIKAIADQLQYQENMRLLYVAITRARYHAYLFTPKNVNDTSLQYLLRPFIEKQKEESAHIRLVNLEPGIDLFGENVNIEETAPELTSNVVRNGMVPGESEGSFATVPNISLPDQYWQKTSYSGLNPKHDLLSRLTTEPSADPYDQFIFRGLPKGARTGNFLHDLFERMDFENKEKWENRVASSLNRYPIAGIKKEEQMENLLQLLEVVLGTELPGGNFSLNKVERSRRLNELEFDLPLVQVDWANFPKAMDGGKIPLRVQDEHTLTGILNGKMDLVFEKDSKYYLLDWKSNHLGNASSDYHAGALAEAMEENNYYLQYHLYCLALHRYLSLRVPKFDYNRDFGGVYYLFVRGMRQGAVSGIYYHKPLLSDLQELESALLASPLLHS